MKAFVTRDKTYNVSIVFKLRECSVLNILVKREEDVLCSNASQT
jgi:hypothetical protein